MILKPFELFGRPIPPRSKRGDAPVVYDDREVKSRGDELGKVWWQGRQWAVTEHGLECRDGTYYIGADRLHENLGGDRPHGWPAHMLEKTWVDTEDFITAWLVAIALHGADVSSQQVRDAVARSHPRRNGPEA